MNFLKSMFLSIVIGLSVSGVVYSSEQIYNFRWYLMNVLEQHCQLVSGSSNKIGAKNPCLISLDPLIQIPLLNDVLTRNDVVKKRQFVSFCQKHMTLQQGKSKLSEYDARQYCKDSYKHFKQAYDRYERGPKLGYAARGA